MFISYDYAIYNLKNCRSIYRHCNDCDIIISWGDDDTKDSVIKFNSVRKCEAIYKHLTSCMMDGWSTLDLDRYEKEWEEGPE